MKKFFEKINLFNCRTLPRKVFTFYFIAIMLGSILLMLPISKANDSISISFIDAVFTTSSAFSNTGLTLFNTGKDFSLFGQIIILLLIQIGGLGLMTFKVLIFLFLGKKIGFKDRMSVTSERGNGKMGGSVDLIKSALIGVFSIELILAILFSLRYYFSYYDNPIFDNNILKIIYQGIFSSISAVNNAGIDVLGNGNSIEMFANDYFIQIITMIGLIIGGLGFPIFYDIKNFFVCKKEKTKFHLSYFTKFILRVYFGIALFSIIIIFIIELTSGTLLHNKDIPVIQRIFYVIFNSFSARNAGHSTIDINRFAEGTKIILALLMWIGSAPASTGGGIRSTTFFICILAIISYSKNKKEVTFLGRKIPTDTVIKSLIVTFISLILIFTVSTILVTNLNNITFLDAFFESCSAFGVTGLSLGITSSLNTLCKLSIIFLMFIGQLGVSNAILMWASNKTSTTKTTLPEEDILIN